MTKWWSGHIHYMSKEETTGGHIIRKQLAIGNMIFN